MGNVFGLGSSIIVVLNGSDFYWYGIEVNEYNVDSNIWVGILDVILMNKV